MSAPSIVDLIADVESDLNEHGLFPAVYFGKDIPAQEGDPEQGRVVFWPKDFDISSTERRVGGNPRPMATWKQDLQIHVWKRAPEQTDASKQYGADYDAALLLSHAVVASMVRAFTYGSFLPGKGTPSDQTRTVVYGAELVFRATVWLPVIDQSWPIVAVAASDTDKMRFPDEDHIAQPSA